MTEQQKAEAYVRIAKKIACAVAPYVRELGKSYSNDADYTGLTGEAVPWTSIDAVAAELEAERIAYGDARETKGKEEERESKDGAYRERNMLVAAFTKLFPAHLARHDESDKTWERDWMWIVYIDLPTGQVSWHIHDSERGLFDHLEVRENNWDGHNTERKYQRLAALSALTPPPQPDKPEGV